MVFDRKTKFVFRKISKTYDKFRETYPKRLFDDAISLAKLETSSKTLEIGSGTGKATLPFAKLSSSMVCIDANQEQINEAIENLSECKSIRYICGSFEEVKLPWDSFDFIFAAQAWHWINPRTGYAKVERLLKDNGIFAIFWKLQDGDQSKLVRKIDELYIKHCPKWNGYMLSAKRVRKEISTVKAFSLLTVREYKSKRNYTKNELIGLASTYSFVATLKESKRQVLFNQLFDLLKGRKEPIAIPYKYTLMIFKKTA